MNDEVEIAGQTSASIGNELLPLRAVFSGVQFRVADYQRGYSWEREHVEALLQDIDHLLADEKTTSHYTGTLVLGRTQNRNSSVYDIVDGQQRMTTLVILMNELARYFDDATAKVLQERYLWRGVTGQQRTVLQLTQDARHFFERVILGSATREEEPSTLDAHANLFEAKKVISKGLTEKERISDYDFTQLLSVVESKFGFLAYSPRNDAEIGIMFEVINNLSKPLSELEKVKNYLIYCCAKLSADSLRESINQDWAEILRNLNVAGKTKIVDQGSFLRYCAVVELGLSKKASQYVYDELRKRLDISKAVGHDIEREKVCKVIGSFVRFLLIASHWYARLYGRRHEGLSPELISIMDQLRAQSQHASIMPLFLALVIRLSRKPRDLLRLLELLEKLNFRVYMVKGAISRNDSGQARLYDYASRYYRDDGGEEWLTFGKKKVETSEQGLEQKLVEFILRHSTDKRLELKWTPKTGQGYKL